MSSVAAEPPAVLVVDDNPLITNVLKSLLQSERYEVVTSANGREAFEALKKKPFDVIICDVMMPAMDGYQLHKQLRGNAEYSHIPFIFLTALSDDSEVSRGLEEGADSYVVKPFEPRSLLSVIKGKVARSRALREGAEQRYESYRKRVIHTLSHEFRTPLVAINTGAELLLEQQQQLDKNKMAQLLEAIHRGGMRLERLVNDFMLLQQIEAGIAGKMLSSRGVVRGLKDSIDQFLEGFDEELTREDFRVTVEDRSDSARAHLYEPYFHDILSRLMHNALKFKKDDRLIEILIADSGREAVVAVCDRGMGLDVARVQNAIEAFGQINREKLEQQGSGLGLTIASQYARVHRGRLELENRRGGGTIVRIILPIVDEDS